MKNFNLKNKLKSIICLVVATLQIVLYGCNQEPDDALPEQIEILENAIISAPEGEYSSSLATVYDACYPSFEESLDDITDVVKATYITSKQFYGNYVHIFEMNESLKNEIKEKQIYVWGHNYDYGLGDDSHKIEYIKDQKYLLLLERYSDPFISFDTFKLAVDKLIIPLNIDGEPNIAQSTRYGRNLLSILKNQEIVQACEGGELITCLLDITKNNPDKNVFQGFSETYDKKSAIQTAEYVLQIDVSRQNFEDSIRRSPNPHVRLLPISIRSENVLKGNTEEILSVGTVKIYLPVTIADGIYIVAVNKSNDFLPPYYVPSTRNSIYSIADYAEVLEIINTVNDNES